MKNAFVIIGVAFLLTGCSENTSFLKTVSSNVLANTGLVSYDQADKLFDAGDKLADAASTFTEEEEYYLGRGVSAMILTRYQAVNNPALVRYVNLVGRTVAAASPKPETFAGYHFEVLESEEANAFAAPGGFIFVTTGLLKLVPDEDALAVTLAHEVAHVVNGDGVNAISNANLTEAALLIGSTAASRFGNDEVQAASTVFGSSINNIFETLITKGYSRSQEYDADKLAVEIAQNAGYNPYAAVTLMAKMEQAESSVKESGGLFSTHPDAEDRREEFEELVEGNEPTPAQLVRAKRFKQAVG